MSDCSFFIACFEYPSTQVVYFGCYLGALVPYETDCETSRHVAFAKPHT